MTGNQVHEFGGLAEGHWYTLVNVSVIKKCLKCKMDDAMRFEFSQHLEKAATSPITTDMVRVIAPACDAAMAMIKEMQHLSVDDKCRVMRRPEVFQEFIRLNPTITDAIGLYVSLQRQLSMRGA